MKGNNLSDVKRANRQFVYDCLRTHKQLTMSELEHVTRLSRPTIQNLIQEMCQEELVNKSGYGTSNGGRIPVLYGINAKAAYAMGIDIEFPAVRMAICDLDCQILAYSEAVYPSNADAEQVECRLLEQIETFLANTGIGEKQLLGIGIGVPGVIDYKTNQSILFEKIKGWENISLRDVIQKRINCPVYICNDVNLLSWAERKRAKLENVSNMLYIIIRAGIGMAIWSDGRLLQGEQGNAGRIGHMSVNSEGALCKCGSRGCLALYTNERAICDMYEQRTGIRIGTKEIAERAVQGEETAFDVMKISGQYLGVGIVNVANLFDISRVVLSTAFDSTVMMRFVEEALKIRKENTIRREVQIQNGILKKEEFGLGGCLLVLEKEYKTLLEKN